MNPEQLASLRSTLLTRELIHCIWFHSVFESVNSLNTERYKLICSFGQVKFSLPGQVHCDHLLVRGQVENFTISTPLSKNIEKTSK